jgi:hypothetical protein
MLHTNYLLNRGSGFLISKFFYKYLMQLPRFLSGFLIIWFNLKEYKKISILIFIFLNVLTKASVVVSKLVLNCFFLINLSLGLILNFINIYLSNIDITLNKLLLNKGHGTLGVNFSYSKIPVTPEFNNFFEQVSNLLAFFEENKFSLHLYIRSLTIISVETFLRVLKLPVILSM